jgi:hypothetical protein
MAPRAEALGSEVRKNTVREIDLSGYMLYDGEPHDIRLPNALKIQPERIPEGVIVSIPKEKFDMVPLIGKTIDRTTFSQWVSQATRVSMSQTPVTVTNDGEGTTIITTGSKAVSLLLQTFYETHDRKMFLYPNPAASIDVTLDVEGIPSLDDHPTAVVGRVIFQTESQPSNM